MARRSPPATGDREPGFPYEQLRFLNRVARHVGAATDLAEALGLVLEWLAQECAMHRGVIALMTESGDEVQAAFTARGISSDRSGRMRYRLGEGVTGKVFAAGRPLYLPRLDSDPGFLDRSGLRRDLDPAALAFFCVPIGYQGTTIGTLSADKQTEAVVDADQELALLGEVADLIAPFVQRRRLEDRLEVFQRARSADSTAGKLIGRSALIEEVQRLAARVAQAGTTVLITGETGTGKGVVAGLIHQLSPRAGQPFVEVNCGAIPETLLESELFGHEKGAFTGATEQRVGVLERARGGTVFLDEIGELPLVAQTRLLRVLQTREFERVGGTRTLHFAGRVVAATNRDLAAAIEAGGFRRDLFYRLNVFPIHVPALRDRGKADVMLLADHFVQRFSREMRKPVTRLDTPAIDMLTAYHWPGNVRELENVIERAVLLAETGVIHGHHLPPSLQMNRYAPQQEDLGDFLTQVRNFEIELITEALKDSNGNQTKAAARLGITKRIIQYKIQAYGIDWRRLRRGGVPSPTAAP